MRRRSRSGLAIPLLLGVAALTAAAPAPAQEAPGLKFVGGLGYAPGGPGPALVDELDGAGLDGVRAAECHGTICVPAVEYPFYFDEGLNLSVLLGFRYRFAAPISVETLLSNGQRGHAEGLDPVTRDHLVVQYSTFMLSSTLGVHLGPLRLEAGPILNTTVWKGTQNSVRSETTRSWSLGGTAGLSAGVRFNNVLVSLKAGVQQFPPSEFTVPVQVPLQADYRSFLVGVTASPAH